MLRKLLLLGVLCICPLLYAFSVLSSPGLAKSSMVQHSPGSLPHGEGQEQVQAFCTSCHDLERVVSQRKSAQGWQSTVRQMFTLAKRVDDGEARVISSYLATHFGVPLSEALSRLLEKAQTGDLESAQVVAKENLETLLPEMDLILAKMDRGFDELGRQKARSDQLRSEFDEFFSTWMRYQPAFEAVSKVTGESSYAQHFRAKRLRVEGARHTTEADFHWNRQEYRAALDQYAEGIRKLQEGASISRDLNDRKLLAGCLNNMGYAEIYSGQVEEGLRHYEESLEIAKQRGDSILEGMYTMNVGTFYLYTFQPDKALQPSLEATALHQKNGRKTWEANGLLNSGVAYLALKQHEQADSYLQKALLRSQESRDRRAQGRILFNLALTRSNFGPPEGATEQMERALEFYLENEDVFGNGEQFMVRHSGLMFLSRFYEKAGQTEEASSARQELRELLQEDPEKIANYMIDPHLNYRMWDRFQAKHLQ